MKLKQRETDLPRKWENEWILYREECQRNAWRFALAIGSTKKLQSSELEERPPSISSPLKLQFTNSLTITKKKNKESCLPGSSNGEAEASQNLEKVEKEHSHQAQ